MAPATNAPLVAGRIDTEALKRDRPLVDVVAAAGIALRREGAGTYRALCPFHQERTPSFWIDARGDTIEQHYFCFGCSAHGDCITFVMEREACSFQEACERLSNSRRSVVEPVQRAAGKLPARRWEQLSANSVEAHVLELTLQLYERELQDDRRAQAYLRGRSVSEKVARTQRLGYASGRALLKWLRDNSQTGAELVPVAVRLGLLLERPRADNEAPLYREFFFDRLIVPELRQGRPIWYIGRAVEHVRPAVTDLPDGTLIPTCELEPPAGQSPGSPHRPRPRYLGLPGEKPIMGLEHVVGRRAAFMVEGPFDLLAGIGWNLPAFAICGTHFPVERMSALGDALAIYGVFDPDRAGLSAAEHFAPHFGDRWRPIQLPNGLDLAELATLGPAGREMLDVLVGRARAAAWRRAQVT